MLKVQRHSVVRPGNTMLPRKQAAFAPFKKAKSRTGCLVLDFEGFAAAFAGAESEVDSETLVGLFD